MLRLIALFTVFIATAAWADPVRYALDPDRSTVRFVYTLTGQPVEGRMPVSAARIAIDFQRLGASVVDVTLDAASANAGPVFATEAMRGPSVLDTSNHPTIRFQATAIDGDFSRATLDGQLTIRGTTRPSRLTGGVFRPEGSAPEDLSDLTILLRAEVSRAAFGAAGFPQFVGDRIDIDIVARIRQVN